MARLNFIRTTVLSAVLALTACSDRSERNVILERPPFIEDVMPYSPAETERVISTVRRFAKVKGMDFLLARESLPSGDYNATAAGRDLNFTVIHTSAISPKTAEIWVYSRSNPREADQTTARAFVCAVKNLCPF